MIITKLDFLDANDRLYFGGRVYKHLEARDMPGLEMSLNPQSCMVSIDAPGYSSAVHLSRVAVSLTPAIQRREPPPPAPVPEAKPAKGSKVKKAKGPVEAEDIDDEEIAGLLQGAGAKKALEKRKAKKKPGPKKAKIAAPEYVDEPEDEGDDGDA